MKKFAVSLFLIAGGLIAGNLQAQVGLSKLEAIAKVKARTMLVIVEEPSEKLLSTIKPEELENYKKDIADYNAMMAELAPKIWTISPKIEFKTRAEVYKLVEAKDPGYAFMEYEKYRVQFASAASYYATRRACGFKDKLAGTNILGGDYIKSEFSIRLTDDKMYGLQIIGIPMPSPCPTSADLVFAMKTIQLHFKYKEEGLSEIKISQLFKTNAPQLKNMKLYVNKQDTEATLEDIKKVYSHPVEMFEGRAEIDQAILNATEGIAVCIMIPHSDQSYSFYVYKASDLSVLAYTNDSQSTGVSVGGIGMVDMARDLTRNKMKRDHFKIFGKQADK